MCCFLPRAVELLKSRSISLQIAAGSTVAELRDQLIDEHPLIAPLASVSRWAISGEFVSDDFAITQDSVEIAMIPPVSGG